MSVNSRRSAGSLPGGPKAQGVRPMHISLRPGERLFLNGAVLRVDRKATLELLNDATFLLENHVLQVEETKTPLRQLYFAVQAMLMDPQNAPASRALFERMAIDAMTTFRCPAVRGGINDALDQVASERPFHALKTLRGLFAREEALLSVAPEREQMRPVVSARPAAAASPAAAGGDKAPPTLADSDTILSRHHRPNLLQ